MENDLNQPQRSDEINEASTPMRQEATASDCRKLIADLIAEQENVLQQARDTHEKNTEKVIELEKKWLMVKRSLKIAKSEKLGKTSIAMIKEDRKEARRQLKEMRRAVRAEEQDINALQGAIELLKTLV